MGINQGLGIGDPMDWNLCTQPVEPINNPVFKSLFFLPGYKGIAVIDQSADNWNSGNPGSNPSDHIGPPKTGDH